MKNQNIQIIACQKLIDEYIKFALRKNKCYYIESISITNIKEFKELAGCQIISTIRSSFVNNNSTDFHLNNSYIGLVKSLKLE